MGLGDEWDKRFGPMPNMVVIYGGAPLPADGSAAWKRLERELAQPSQ